MVNGDSERTGRPLAAACAAARGKSGLHRTGWWVTPTGRKARESATESRPLAAVHDGWRVRVKRRGKSSPAGWATSLARQTPPGARPNREDRGQTSSGPVRPAIHSRVGRLSDGAIRRLREMAVAPAAAKTAAGGQNPAYRSAPNLFLCLADSARSIHGRQPALSVPAMLFAQTPTTLPCSPTGPARRRPLAATWKCRACSCWCGGHEPRPATTRASSWASRTVITRVGSRGPPGRSASFSRSLASIC